MKSRIIKCLIVLGIMSNIIRANNTDPSAPRAHYWAKTIDMTTPGSVISSNIIEVNALSALTIGAATRIYVAGTFTGSITLPGGIALTSSGGKDVFIGSYDPNNGNFYGATRIGGVNDDVATGIALRTGSTHANVRVMVSANYNFNTISNIAFATTNGAFVTPGVVNAGQGKVSGITTNGTFFYLAGTFSGPLSFPNPGGTPFSLSLASGLTQDVFVAKIQTSAVISSSTVVTR